MREQFRQPIMARDLDHQLEMATQSLDTPEGDDMRERAKKLTKHQQRKIPPEYYGGQDVEAPDPFPPHVPLTQPSQLRSYGDRDRPSHDEIAMEIAHVWAKRSTCPRLHVGAVIMDDRGRILTSGYNGAPRHQPHCDTVGCLLVNGRCERAVHAEANAIIQAATTGISIAGMTLYCTHRPCIACAKLIVQAQLAGVVWATGYDGDGVNDEVLRMFGNAHVQMIALAYQTH